MKKETILERIASGKILVADGATGTNLQKRGLPLGAPSDRWVLENPEQIIQLHRDFIAAGSNLILTCTFGGTSIRLEQSGLEDHVVEINRKAYDLAKEAVGDKDVYIAASIGPLGHLLKPLGPVDEEDAFKAYQNQIQILADAGVEVLVIETQFDLAEATIAVKAARSVSNLPLVCSFSYDRGVRTMMGLRPTQAAERMVDLGADVIGVNCGKSLDDNELVLQELRKASSLPIWFKPNAGHPDLDEKGTPVYHLSPEDFGLRVSKWIEWGASVVGGCCGTSPEHLAALAKAVKEYPSSNN